MTTDAESINSDLQCERNRRLRRKILNTEQNRTEQNTAQNVTDISVTYMFGPFTDVPNFWVGFRNLQSQNFN